GRLQIEFVNTKDTVETFHRHDDPLVNGECAPCEACTRAAGRNRYEVFVADAEYGTYFFRCTRFYHDVWKKRVVLGLVVSIITTYFFVENYVFPTNCRFKLPNNVNGYFSKCHEWFIFENRFF